MRKSEHMLGEDFSATGKWWLPDNPDAKVFGTLTYSRTKIELVLSGEFERVPLAKLMTIGEKKFKDYPCIHGQSNDGEKFSLLATSCTLLGETTNFFVRFVIVGAHTTSADDVRIEQMSLYCSHLDTFLICKVLGYKDDKDSGRFTTASIEYHHPEKLGYRLTPINAQMDFEVEPLVTLGTMRHAIDARALISIRPDTPQNVAHFLKAAWRMCYMLTLFTDEKVSPTGFIIKLEGDKYVKSLLVAESSFASLPAENATPVFLFHLGHIKDNFQTALDRWFSASDMLLESIYLTMDAHRNEYHSIQGRFLMLAQAVEVASRALSSSEYMSKDDFEAVANVLSRAIPGSVEADHRTSLKQRIKFLYEYSFKKRILTLLGGLSADAVAVVCNDPKEFAMGIADTRNYFTHYTDELRKVTLQGDDLFWASEKLLLLLRIVLLKHLGIDEKLIVERLKDHHRLMQRIAIAKRHRERVAPPPAGLGQSSGE